jgi:hypothetical protein
MLQLTNALERSGLGYSCELDAVPFSVYRAVRDEFSGHKLSLANHPFIDRARGSTLSQRDDNRDYLNVLCAWFMQKDRLYLLGSFADPYKLPRTANLDFGCCLRFAARRRGCCSWVLGIARARPCCNLNPFFSEDIAIEFK